MSGVAPHSDGRNFILTAHLGLKIPTGCWIKVGEDDDTRNFVSQRGWEEGKIILLDTSFEHSTGNPTTEDRHVLIIDFWHPELSEAEKAALSFIYDLRNQFESGNIPFRTPESIKKQKQSQGLFASIWDSFTK
jgi:aspartate beta-hydroxylase